MQVKVSMWIQWLVPVMVGTRRSSWAAEPWASRSTVPSQLFSTLEALCKALDCQPADLLEYRPDET